MRRIFRFQRDAPREASNSMANFSAVVLGLLAGVATNYSFEYFGRVYGIEIILMLVAPFGLPVLAKLALKTNWVRIIIITLGVTVLAYVTSDLINQTPFMQYLKGWARFAFLVTNLLGALWIVSRISGAVALSIGLVIGDIISTYASGAGLVYWKFGWAEPIALVVVLLACWNRTVGGVALLLLAALNFWLDYRSVGLFCAIVAWVSLTEKYRGISGRVKWVVLAAAAILMAGIVAINYVYSYNNIERQRRAGESNIQRLAMARVSIEAIAESPLLGYGSWARSPEFAGRLLEWRAIYGDEDYQRVYSRTEADERELLISHSYILQSMVEAGIVAVSFFVASFVLIASTVWRLVNGMTVIRVAPLLVYVLIGSLWAICLSPFGGPHRYSFAIALAMALHVHAHSGKKQVKWL